MGKLAHFRHRIEMQADELTGLKANPEMQTSSGQQLNEKIAKMIEQNTTYQAKNNTLQEQIAKLEELLETSETNMRKIISQVMDQKKTISEYEDLGKTMEETIKSLQNTALEREQEFEKQIYQMGQDD
eukprot:UN00905